jgi:hypothetical protein
MSTTRDDIAKVEKESCYCVRCNICGGQGNYRVDLHGRPTDGMDDMDSLEPCEECGGSGIVETCDRCQLLADLERELP